MTLEGAGVPADAGVLIDFGSTYTKIRLVDLNACTLVASGQAPTDVSNLVESLTNALDSLDVSIHTSDLSKATTLASSSAAGGLRMVAVGLTEELTTKAATLAALGAGGKLVGSYAGGLTGWDVAAIEASSPDLVILTGGTDGGNHLAIIGNARRLTRSSIDAPIIVAGNRNAAEEVSEILGAGDKVHYITANVLPSLDRLDVEPCRELVREVFMTQIVRAKGLEQVEELIGRVIMPTPQAVLRACRLLADGPRDDPGNGLGDLVAVDIGGATTDVYSISDSTPTTSGRIFRGLPEPRDKRTVEGDLGIRVNAASLYAAASAEKMFYETSWDHETLQGRCARLAAEPSRVPVTEDELALDVALAEAAALLAVRRHAGTLEVHYGPAGPITVQRGKDLTGVGALLATGGVVAANRTRLPNRLRQIFNEDHHQTLTPNQISEVITDRDYMMFAIGLLSTVANEEAFRLGCDSLPLGSSRRYSTNPSTTA